MATRKEFLKTAGLVGLAGMVNPVSMMAASTAAFAAVLGSAVPLAAAAELTPPGIVYRFEGG